jgi:hypothetical protein
LKSAIHWISRPSECPKKALGLDYDGADFTHVKNLVKFEVLMTSFGLDTDPALVNIGRAGTFPRRGWHTRAGRQGTGDDAQGRKGESPERRCAAVRGNAGPSTTSIPRIEVKGGRAESR